MARAAQVPDRIRGFTTLAEHEASTYEGKVLVSERDGARLRRIWHEGHWWQSVVDVVGHLTESVDGRKYWNKLKQRLVAEGAAQSVTDCHQLKLPSADGKNYKTDCAPTDVLLRIVESVPSRRAEPIKMYLAEVGAVPTSTALQTFDLPSACSGWCAVGHGDPGNPGSPENLRPCWPGRSHRSGAACAARRALTRLSRLPRE
jgi:hypothetical protein